jgi:hypothetical protein
VRIKPKQILGELTIGQHMTLLHGDPILPADDFSSDAEARAAWCQHRTELLAEFSSLSPGQRPYGFWAYDMGRDDAHRLKWWQEAQLLLEMGALVGEEAARFERLRFPPMSLTDPKESAHSVLAVIREERRQRRMVGALTDHHARRELEEMTGEREFRLNWHRAHGEELLVEFYKLILAGLHRLKETET